MRRAPAPAGARAPAVARGGRARGAPGALAVARSARALRVLVPLAGAAAALALAACGTPSPDLFVAERDGSVPGAGLHLLISDTSVRCNHGEPLPLTSKQTIEARDITDDLIDVQTGVIAYPKPPPAQIFHFKIADEEGMLRFPDTAQRPPVLPRTARFIRRVAIDTCKLTR